MQKLFTAIKDGFIKALKTGGMLLRIVLPVYAIVVVIRFSPIMPWLQEFFAPAMGIFNLPAEAVVPIVTGVFTDEYGVAAAMGNFNFTTAQLTTIAMFTLVFHSIPVESAVTQKIGMSAWKFALYRFIFAIVTGLMVGWIGGIIL